MKTTMTGARCRAGNERQVIACSEIFLHLACKAKEKKVVCIFISMHKNVKIINTTKILP